MTRHSEELNRQLARKLVLALGTSSFLLLGIVTWTLVSPASLDSLGIEREAVRERTVELVQGAGGIFDSHPDPEIGRLLMPGIEGRKDAGVLVSSNTFGVRERAYALPKPEGTLRIVLLGDSMVFGHGLLEEDRVGQHLSSMLKAVFGGEGRSIECLHLGITAWNIRAECAFLRRQASLLRPDVVLHFVVRNDLDDNPSIRGFGVMADFTDQHRERADGTLTDTHPRHLGARSTSLSPLFAGLDFEGRTRLETAARDVGRLRDVVAAVGGRYVVIIVDPAQAPKYVEYFANVLSGDEIALLPAFAPEYRLGLNDLHWNGKGARRVAEYCRGLLSERRLLRTMKPDEKTSTLFAKLHAVAERELRTSAVQQLVESRIGRRIVLAGVDSDPEGLEQIHGGVMEGGLVLPYASMILRNDHADRLCIQGQFLDRPELRGGTLTIFLEDIELGRIELGSGASSSRAFEVSYLVPSTLRESYFLGVRFVADDWVLDGSHLRKCVCFVLRKVELSR